MSNKDSAKPIAWAFIIALIAGGIVVFLAVAGRMNQRIEEQRAQKAAAGNAAHENGAPAPAADAGTQAPVSENANPAPAEGAPAP